MERVSGRGHLITTQDENDFGVAAQPPCGPGNIVLSSFSARIDPLQDGGRPKPSPSLAALEILSSCCTHTHTHSFDCSMSSPTLNPFGCHSVVNLVILSAMCPAKAHLIVSTVNTMSPPCVHSPIRLFPFLTLIVSRSKHTPLHDSLPTFQPSSHFSLSASMCLTCASQQVTRTQLIKWHSPLSTLCVPLHC